MYVADQRFLDFDIRIIWEKWIHFEIMYNKCIVHEDVISLETIKVPFVDHLVHGQ